MAGDANSMPWLQQQQQQQGLMQGMSMPFATGSSQAPSMPSSAPGYSDPLAGYLQPHQPQSQQQLFLQQQQQQQHQQGQGNHYGLDPSMFGNMGGGGGSQQGQFRPPFATGPPPQQAQQQMYGAPGQQQQAMSIQQQM